jgi:hypothetical protein
MANASEITALARSVTGKAIERPALAAIVVFTATTMKPRPASLAETPAGENAATQPQQMPQPTPALPTSWMIWNYRLASNDNPNHQGTQHGRKAPCSAVTLASMTAPTLHQPRINAKQPRTNPESAPTPTFSA